MNLEKAISHGEHGEKTIAYVNYPNHPVGKSEEKPKSRYFAVPAVFAVVELRFLGLAILPPTNSLTS
ncbi:MAG: hypothetical protein WCL27_01200 [Betaproteobacteria bacterium]